MKLVIAEKNSVAQAIAQVLGVTEKKSGYMEGGGFIISWCVGHLVGLCPASAYGENYKKWSFRDLPILPEAWKNTAISGKEKQLDTLKVLMNRSDVDTVINACDAGREGELIFRLVYDYCGCTKLIQRLWISSMEDSAIRDGFDNLRPGEDYDNLYGAALCRSRADWLVGINATRLFSVLYGATLNVGRVMTPTLTMLTQRVADINSFVQEPFYIPEIHCGGVTAKGVKEADKGAAAAVTGACDGQSATVVSIEKQEKTINPPKLYDLTSLQRDCNRLLGFTAQQTLDYAQSLYEKKLITYPRTDSRYLTSDMEGAASSIANWLQVSLPWTKTAHFTPDLGHTVDNKKVTDHHAIIPTLELAETDISVLPGGELDVLNIVFQRLLCASAPIHSYEEVAVVFDCSGHSFTVKGRTVLRDGWKAIERAYNATLKEKDADAQEDSSLPELVQSQVFESVSASIREGKTTPPKHFTEDTLLSAMEKAGAEDMPEDAERQGLGTPATRAGVIEKLIKAGFMERNKRQLLPSTKAVNLIAVLPDDLKSPKLTAQWEHRLSQIEQGELSSNDFMTGIEGMIQSLVDTNSTPLEEYRALFSEAGAGVGACPRCGRIVRESKKGFFCDDRQCGFKVWKDNRFFKAKRKKLDKKTVAVLLKEGRIFISGLYSEKTGKTYDATVVMDAGKCGDRYVNFTLEFKKQEDK